MIRLALILIFAAVPLAAHESEPPMTYERLGNIVFALDPDAQPHPIGFEMTISEVPVLVITDPDADRMRAMVLISPSSDLTAQDMLRMMQANFDSALDARYAIAKDSLWAAFIHPLSSLGRDQLISGLAQTVNLANSYGTLYSSGSAEFGGGDSNDLQRALIEELLKKGEEI